MVKILYILIAILILCFIVVIHEFGHFLMGRLMRIGIVEFSVGFGPKIFSRVRKGTRYSLRAIPLGGYCRFVGEDEENSAPDAFNRAPVWKRFLTVAAGPILNFLLAFIFCVILLCCYGVQDVVPGIGAVYENTPAAAAGVAVGDVILEIDGVPLEYGSEGVLAAQGMIRANEEGEPLSLTIRRNGELVNLDIVPQTVVDELSGENVQQIGISFAYGIRRLSLPRAMADAPIYMVDFTGQILSSLKNLIFRGEGVENMMSAVGVVHVMSDMVYDAHLYAAVYLVFVISLNLGIMNLLPLPALDGGRLVLLVIEAIRRKPLPPEKEGIVHTIGFLLLIGVFIFFAYKDILRIIGAG